MINRYATESGSDQTRNAISFFKSTNKRRLLSLAAVNVKLIKSKYINCALIPRRLFESPRTDKLPASDGDFGIIMKLANTYSY